MHVLGFTDVDHILAFNQGAKDLEEGSHVNQLWRYI